MTPALHSSHGVSVCGWQMRESTEMNRTGSPDARPATDWRGQNLGLVVERGSRVEGPVAGALALVQAVRNPLRRRAVS
jgi:hypothetical protein